MNHIDLSVLQTIFAFVFLSAVAFACGYLYRGAGLNAILLGEIEELERKNEMLRERLTAAERTISPRK